MASMVHFNAVKVDFLHVFDVKNYIVIIGKEIFFWCFGVFWSIFSKLVQVGTSWYKKYFFLWFTKLS